jgi:hypothetical protein
MTSTLGFPTSKVAQIEEKNYNYQHLGDQFLSVVIKVLGCIHKQVHSFLQDCANNMWGMKGLEGSPLSFLTTFPGQ